MQSAGSSMRTGGICCNTQPAGPQEGGVTEHSWPTLMVRREVSVSRCSAVLRASLSLSAVAFWAAIWASSTALTVLSSWSNDTWPPMPPSSGRCANAGNADLVVKLASG